LQGKRELQAQPSPSRDLVGGRHRRPGGGRKSILEKHPELRSVIEQIVDPATRGDPLKPLRWVSKSLPHIVAELGRQGYQLSLTSLSKILYEELGYGMQGGHGAKVNTSRNRKSDDGNPPTAGAPELYPDP
jgi:Rhodopirellula transposase DDE domain